MNKWKRFMSVVGWHYDGERIFNWNIVDDNLVKDLLPDVQAWVIRNLRYITDHEAKISFKEFYWGEEKKRSAHDYTRKTYVEHALAALYEKEYNHVDS